MDAFVFVGIFSFLVMLLQTGIKKNRCRTCLPTGRIVNFYKPLLCFTFFEIIDGKVKKSVSSFIINNISANVMYYNAMYYDLQSDIKLISYKH